MNEEAMLLAALHRDPADGVAWQALADALEEGGQADRAELLRLDLRLRALPWDHLERLGVEPRLQALLGQGVRPCVPSFVNSVGMSFVLVPAGRFRMGSPPTEDGRIHAEEAQAEVEIRRAFYLGACPVTQEEYQRVTGTNPSWFVDREGMPTLAGLDTSRLPVESVSWEEAFTFCALLSGRAEEQAARRMYRLPTEAEWEYACRAGTSTPFHFGPVLRTAQANFTPDGSGGVSWGRPSPVGFYGPNVWGLHDMHGNVWEWCGDSGDEVHPVRGGCFGNNGASACRSAQRGRSSEGDAQLGFRVLCEVRGEENRPAH